MVPGTRRGVDVAQQPRTELHIAEKTLIRGDYKVITGGFSYFTPQLRPATHNNSGYIGMDGYWPGYGLRATVETQVRMRDCGHGCLFDITSDPNEERDLAAAMPSVAAEMTARLAELNKSLFLPDRGSESAVACEVARGGVWRVLRTVRGTAPC
jgi:arylsulfatase I/J